MNDLIFTPQAFKEYLEWLAEDKKTFKKINDLIKDIQIYAFLAAKAITYKKLFEPVRYFGLCLFVTTRR